jgi:hybrid polyketide synthase/nonribosomal peptide synthetase ACE1
MIRAVGEGLLATLSGQSEGNILATMMNDNLLNEYYSSSVGMGTYLDDMGCLVGQLSHRFPRMNILEVGAGIGAATAAVLRHVGDAFASYTYTDISATFFQKAREKFARLAGGDGEDESRMAFRVLDIEQPAAAQGFASGSFDVVVASLVLHATRSIDKTLAEVRRLLRPGGYLVMLEVTSNDALRPGLLFGGLPGWWLGREDKLEDRRLSPCLSTRAWDKALRRTGFGGVDMAVPHSDRFALPLSVLVAQAVDERVRLLRDPFHVKELGNAEQKNQTMPTYWGDLTIVGRHGQVSEQLHGHLAGHYRHVRLVDTLDDLATERIELPFAGTVVSLVDCEPSPSDKFTAAALGALQKLFQQSRIILWVSSGARCENPHNNIFSGLQRSVVLEMSHVCAQMLDFEPSTAVDAQEVAKRLLHLELGCLWRDRNELPDMLWHIEPEIFVERTQGRRTSAAMVPRVRPSVERNLRFNSTRRLLTQTAARGDAILAVRKRGSGPYYVWEQGMQPAGEHPDSGGSGLTGVGGEVQLTHSLLKAVCITNHCTAFVSLGEKTRSGERVIVLSSLLDSRVHAPPGWILAAHQDADQAITAMVSLYMQLLARSILANAKPGKSLIVLNPDRTLGEALARLAADRGVSLFLLTTTTAYHSQSRMNTHATLPWVPVHPRATQRFVRGLVPPNASAFVDLSGQPGDISMVVQSCLPASCPRLNRCSFVSDDATLDPTTSSTLVIREVSDILQSVWLGILAEHGKAPANMMRSMLQVDLQDIISTTTTPSTHRWDEQALLSWNNTRETLQIPIQPASARVRFSPDRTYWLVGLTGGLGLSLCQWMAERGARHIALSSRNPKIEPAWLDAMASRYGCRVQVFANDVTDSKAVHDLVHGVMAPSMPPLAGVVQGAMELCDAVFPDLDIDRLRRVLAPKVDGSANLDAVFGANNNNNIVPSLDFFVCLSSLAYVVGNRGQSAYTAANAFMTALMARRRKQGLAGSVVHVGGILGEGYLARQLTLEKQALLRRAGFAFMSEQAFHELFAEGVLSSHANATGGFEIAAGIQVEGDNSEANFAHNPIFQHLLARKTSAMVVNATGGGVRGNSSRVGVKAQLHEAVSEEEVLTIIRGKSHTQSQVSSTC